jgi:hypothetical protein
MTLVSTAPDLDWHVVSFVQSSGQITIYLDGKNMETGAVSGTPVAVGFGDDIEDPVVQWNDQEFQFVRVDRGIRLIDRSALRDVP